VARINMSSVSKNAKTMSTNESNNVDASKKAPVLSSPSLHEGVRAEICRRIATGIYKPGQAIASTALLGEELGVSPITVKRAVRDLQSAGVLTSVPRKGIFVKEQRRFVRELDAWHSSMDNARQLGFEPSMRLISITRERIEDPTLSVFDAPQGAQLCVRKVIYADGTPIMYDSAYVPADLPEAIVDEFGERLIIAALRRHKVEIKDLRLVIDAAPASPGAQQVFSIPSGYPMLRRLYQVKTKKPGVTVIGVVESPFDRTACSINFSAEQLARMHKPE
jgi:DNA-binding GntR family transcriptional regulator